MSDIWGKIKSAVSKAAPLLGSVVGGPVGTGIALITKALGGDAEKPEELLSLINDPDAIIKLKEIETKHEQALLALSIQQDELVLKREKSILDDKSSARSREVEITKSTGKTDKATHFLAAIITIGFFSVLGALFAKAIPNLNSEVLWIMIGCLGTNFTQVVSYFFGSSMGSAIKNKLIGVGKEKK